MISGDSVILGILLVILEIDTFMSSLIMLNSIVINRILSDLIHVLHW